MNKTNGMMGTTHYLCVDYEEFKPDTYKGVVISETGNSKDELIRVFSGDLERDAQVAEQILNEMTGGYYNVVFSSTYDSYFDDVEYTNNPEFKKLVDEEYKKMPQEENK